MNTAPARLGTLLLILLIPAASPAQTVDGTSPSAVPVASVAPAAPGQPLVSDMVHADSQGHHLAPHGTLYLLEYVSVKTDKGVEGFEPGQEVHVVEVHRPTHTLVVSDGRAQVEVSPSKLTHDMDIAAMVRQKDQANQTRIAEYIQKEQAAYNKFEKDAAIASAKDVERADKASAASSAIVDDSGAALAAQPVDATSVSNNGYYGQGSYGYGSPYSYFPEGGESVTIVNPNANPAARGGNSGATGPNPATVGTAGGGKVAAPAGGTNPATVGTAGKAGR